MSDWISDSDDELNWDTAGSRNDAGTSAAGSRNLDAPGPSTRAGPSSSLVEHFLGMGFEEKIVLKAIKENGDSGAESLLELLLTYKEIGDDDNSSNSGFAPRAVDNNDDDEEDSNAEVAGSLNGAGTLAAASRSLDAPGPSTRAGPSSSLVEHFVGMGFEEKMVLKVIKENGDADADSLVELLLTYKAIGNDGNCSYSGGAPRAVDNEDDDEDSMEDWNDEAAGRTDYRVPKSDDSDAEEFLQELTERDEKFESLVVKLGFPEEEANMAISRCGQDASLAVLVDSIYASEIAGASCYAKFSDHEDNSCGGRKKKRFNEGTAKKRKIIGGEANGSRESFDGSHDAPMPLPNPMVGFGLPTDRLRSVGRSLPRQALGPPFFYYENVALAPKGVWTTISRFLYDIQPEFVDSKYFCASARKRGYIHNLPLENRKPLLPLPPKTIFEVFPHTKRWWPSWDLRKQLNCLQTVKASSTLLERIRLQLSTCEDPPHERVQKEVLEQCRKWNLVWVGRDKVTPLDPQDMELLLGFPMHHTSGISITDRYKALGNSFQVDTVAYHLSVLKAMFPHGMNVLSLFTGIGGGEVALHRLGIHLKTVVSVEKSEKCRTVLQSWWHQTQTGTLIEIHDVETLTEKNLESLIRRAGGFDLVIGGSPCNNLAGSNRHHRDGLDGEQSSLFFKYAWILDTVKGIMGRMQ